MLKVLISTSTLPLEPGDGIPRFVHDLGQSLAAHCSVTVLAPDAPGARRLETSGSVELHRFVYFLPRSRQRLAYGHGMRENMRHSWLARLQPIPYLASLTRSTSQIVDRLGIEVVNSHWLVPQGLATALVRSPRARFGHVLSIHAGDIYLLRRLPWGRSIARFVVDRSDRIFADGSHVRDSLDALLGSPSNAVIQPMGVDLIRFQSGSEVEPPFRFPRGYLAFVGRLTEKKGAVFLLRALKHVHERHPGLGLVVIGYGPLAEELRQETVRLGIVDSVCFLGARGHTEVASYLRGARLAVVPSIVDRYGETEGMPTVVLEAMAAGARVVGTTVDGIPDVIRHRDNGWLCRPGDAEHLAEAILDALDDPCGSAIAHRAQATAQRHDWPHVALAYARAIEHAAAARAQAPSGGPAGGC